MLLIILIILLILALPTYSYSSEWGYSPAGLILAILVIVLLFRLL